MVRRAHDEWQQDRPGLYGKNIRIRKHPVGVVAAVVPWNMPQFLTVAKVIPALLAGCSVVLKPAPESVLDAQLLADLVAEADLPSGVLNVVPGGREVGEALVSHAGVDKVSFTGSTAAGRQVALACAAGPKQVSLDSAASRRPSCSTTPTRRQWPAEFRWPAWPTAARCVMR